MCVLYIYIYQYVNILQTYKKTCIRYILYHLTCYILYLMLHTMYCLLCTIYCSACFLSGLPSQTGHYIVHRTEGIDISIPEASMELQRTQDPNKAYWCLLDPFTCFQGTMIIQQPQICFMGHFYSQFSRKSLNHIVSSEVGRCFGRQKKSSTDFLHKLAKNFHHFFKGKKMSSSSTTYPPGKLTCPLKRDHVKRKFHLTTINFPVTC